MAMNEYEETRRAFLAKLGLTVGTTIAASTKLSATVLNDKMEFPLTAGQQEFMENYEKWMDKFIPAVKAQRENQDDMKAKTEIVKLSEEANKWQPQLIEYMKDDNFARYYMTVTERTTKEIF
jgi:hypothetical protein